MILLTLFSFGLSQVGIDGCKGFSIATSKYCGAFSKIALGKRNFLNATKLLFSKVESTKENTEFLRSLGVEDIKNAEEFDEKVIENVVLKHIGTANTVWFRCQHQRFGVQWSMSWFCNILLNQEVEGITSPCHLQEHENQTGLCRDTVGKIFVSASNNIPRDPACMLEDTKNFRDQKVNEISTIFLSYSRTRYANGSEPDCLSGEDVESKRNLCGYPNKQMACANKCSDAECGIESVLIIVICVIGSVLVIVIVAFIIIYKRKRKVVVAPDRDTMVSDYQPSRTVTMMSFSRSIQPDDSASNIGGLRKTVIPVELQMPDGSISNRVFENYRAIRPDELSLCIGDLVVITSRFNDGWATGYTVDAEGFQIQEGAFPLAALKII